MNKAQLRAGSLVLALVVLLAGFSLPANAQILYGSIVGLIEDPSGSSIPNAKVTATNSATGLVYEATTDASGVFTIANVQPGTYDLKVAVQGFKSAARTGLVVTNNVLSRSNFRLEVGALSEQITVAAEAVQLQADKADTHTEINAGLVKSMPLPGFRNYQSLINLVPGATPAAFQNSATDTPGRSLTTNINGTNRNSNTTRIDGATSINLWLPHHAGYVMPAEMVENVNVTTSAGDAEQGFAGGAAVAVITKSGTNEFHGSAFWFHDNQRLRARNFFFTPTTNKPVSIYNNFGGTVGGPIIKNKLFFFYSYDNTKQRTGAFGTYSVPTTDIRTGNFSAWSGAQIFDPATGSVGQRTLFPNNTIPPSRLSPQALRIQEFYPTPNIAGRAQQNYAIGATPQFNRDFNDIKINFNPSTNQMIWGKFGRMGALVGGRGIFGEGVGPAPGSDPGLGDTIVKIASVGHTRTLSPSLVLDGVFGFQRQDQVVQGQDFGIDFSSRLGIPGLGFAGDPRTLGFPNVNPGGGYNGFGVPGWMPLERIEETFNTSHNLRWIKGSHSMAFGFDGALLRMNHWQPELGGGPRGVFNFTGGVTANTGNGNNFNNYASFLLGLTNSVSKSVQNILNTTREWQFGLYFQDRWQLNRKLTLNYGVRYEIFPLMTRAAGKGIERLDPFTNQVFLGGRGNVPVDAGFKVSKLLFAPRLGIAYRLNDATVIRTGYGLTYSPQPWSRSLRGQYPLVVNADFRANDSNTSLGTLAQGFPDIALPDIDSGVVNLPPSAGMRSPWGGEINRGYIQSWNFTIERRLPGEILGSIAYVGTKTTNQLADRDVNAGQVIGAGNAGRPFASQFGRNIPTNMWDGYIGSNYHSLQTSIRRQYRGLTLQGAYTWSKALNWSADDEGWAGVPFNQDFVFHRNYARAGYDRRHVFQLGYVYDLPFGKGQRWASSGVLSQVIGGWTISGVTAAYTGTPFTVTSPGGTLNLPGATQTADQVNSVVARPEQIGADGRFYDTSAWRAVTLAPGERGRFGSSGLKQLSNPGILRTDLTLSKTFKFFERVDMTIRGEAYNFTNSRLSTGFASTDVTNPNFLRVTSAFDERQFRLGLRFAF
ncbi:MAG: TonB-dependent receptor [Bryobacter sp.]|nr:TonB-dependent receptor [Bryobacter sp.]